MNAPTLLTDRLIPVEKDGKTFWLTQEQYDEMVSGIADLDCVSGTCKIREKVFHVPDFIRGKQLINETCLT